MTSHVKEVIKNLVLANEDDDIVAIASVTINKAGEPELQIGMPHEHAYKLLASIEILKFNIVNMMLTNAGKPLGNRE